MRRSILICWLICRFLLQSITGQHPYDSVRNPEATDFAPIVQFLSSPELEGRMTGEKGNKIAALYIASNMQQLRLKPFIHSAGKSTDAYDYFQEFQVDKIKRLNTYMVFTGSNIAASDTFRINEDFFAAPFYNDFEITGKPYVSFINAPHLLNDGLKLTEQNIPDAKKDIQKDKKIHFASIEVLSDTPGSADQGTTIDQKALKAIIMIRTDEWPGDEWYMTIEYETEFCQSQPGPDPLVKKFYFTKEASQRIVDQYMDDTYGKNGSKFRDPIKGLQIFIHGDTIAEPVTARNVIGVMEGKDTTRTLIIGAHYDHLGKEGDLIYCGADDNASGVAGVLSLAKMWQQSNEKPPVNLMFASWAGEETGKLGSSYFTEHGVYTAKPFLYINMDMISRSDPVDTLAEILSIGYRAKDVHLKELCSGINDRFPRPFRLDLWELDGYSGSDYAPFVSKGIPVLSFFSGFHPDYHTPQDTFERIDTGKMQRILHLVNDIIKGVLVN